GAIIGMGPFARLRHQPDSSAGKSMNHSQSARPRGVTLTLAACAMGLAVGAVAVAKLRYPAAPRGSVIDDYFGTKVADPWRALESLDAPATKKWVSAENALAQ